MMVEHSNQFWHAMLSIKTLASSPVIWPWFSDCMFAYWRVAWVKTGFTKNRFFRICFQKIVLGSFWFVSPKKSFWVVFNLFRQKNRVQLMFYILILSTTVKWKIFPAIKHMRYFCGQCLSYLHVLNLLTCN